MRKARATTRAFDQCRRAPPLCRYFKDKKSDYGVSFPDFPGCITAGTTLEEARRMAAEALSFHIAGMQEYGAAIPEPSTLDVLQNDLNRRM
jgi:predicted RNase H-like HicB family nuclease